MIVSNPDPCYLSYFYKNIFIIVYSNGFQFNRYIITALIRVEEDFLTSIDNSCVKLILKVQFPNLKARKSVVYYIGVA